MPGLLWRRGLMPVVIGAVVAGTGCGGRIDAAAQGPIVSEQATFQLTTVVRGLEHPWGMAFLPDESILITERPGRLRLVQGGQLVPDPIAGVPPVYARGQGGLLDVALDPAFAANRVIYLSYAAEGDGGNSTRVARATLGDARLENLEVIFVAEPLVRSSKHFGSRLAFDPDGYLFVTVGERGQGGLLDVALDPAFEHNRTIYLSYAAEGDGGNSTRVARATLGDARLENLEVIFVAQPLVRSSKHFGSRLAFDPDGYLFITVGERGQGDRAQDLADHNGTVIRLHADGSVPEDNPFVGTAGARPEIFSYGHRNPQGLAIHPETGIPWLHEHGARGGDEINIVRPGLNYGWPVITYGIDYSGAPIGVGTHHEGMEQPIYYWVPSIAPSGMAFYDGDGFPQWRGDLFVGALRSRLLARLELDGERVIAEERLLEGAIGRIRDVEVGPDGYLYLLTDERDGGLYRLEPAENPSAEG